MGLFLYRNKVDLQANKEISLASIKKVLNKYYIWKNGNSEGEYVICDYKERINAEPLPVVYVNIASYDDETTKLIVKGEWKTLFKLIIVILLLFMMIILVLFLISCFQTNTIDKGFLIGFPIVMLFFLYFFPITIRISVNRFINRINDDIKWSKKHNNKK